jgi:membrane fusion protein (multidrug efflux system)
MEAQRNPRRRRAVILSSVLGLALLVTGIGLSCAFKTAGNSAQAKQAKKKPDKDAVPAAPVELSAVSQGSISTYLETSATLEARNSATLVARREGPVVSIAVEEGQWVHTGDVLARLDDKEARLAVERAALAFEAAKHEADRADQLKSQGFMSPKEQDDLDLKRRTTEVELEQAKFNLGLMRITAPFSGRVVDRSIHVGENVTPGKACFSLVDFDPLRARLYFPERQLAAVRVGQEALVSMDSYPGRAFAARVTLVNPVVDQANGTFKVTLELPNPGATLRPGAFARVRVKTGSYESALLLPRRGVLSEDGEDYVFVARGDSAVRVPVKLGAVENDTAQVLTGLARGERVVTVGQGGLKHGSKIRVVRS